MDVTIYYSFCKMEILRLYCVCDQSINKFVSFLKKGISLEKIFDGQGVYLQNYLCYGAYMHTRPSASTLQLQ